MSRAPANTSARAGTAATRETHGPERGGGPDDQVAGPIAKAFQLLQILADAPVEGMGVRAIARDLELPVSSVHRLLGILVRSGMVGRDPDSRRYSIGVEAYRMAARITRGMKLSEIALPALRRLAAEFNETALLGVYLDQQGKMMFSERVDGTELLQYRIALLAPLSLVWGASGKSILAHLGPDVVAAARNAEVRAPASGALPPTADALGVELAAVRRDGYAISEGEKLPGACGVAAPVFGPSGVVGCLCITSPIARLTDATLEALTVRIVVEANSVSDLYSGRSTTTGRPERGSQ